MNLNNIDEKWLSDRLELVLTTQDVKKGLGIQFAKRFANKVYNKNYNYTLQNSLVMREYPISVKRVNKSNKTKFIDLLYLDLDENDKVVIGIENKFLTQDSENQISDYKRTLETLYQGFDVKIVYLTLDGRCPKHYGKDCKCDIICLSWTEDILAMLLLSSEIKIDKINQNISLNDLIKKWQDRKSSKNNIHNDIRDLIDILIEIREIKINIDRYLNQNDKNKYGGKDEKENIISVNYIMDILKIFSSKIHSKSIKVSYIGKCYNLKYETTNYQIFIPVSQNEEQIKHMIKYFCMSITNTYKLDNEYQNSINKISQNYIFDISNNVAKHEIAKYLNNNDCKEKCNKKELENE